MKAFLGAAVGFILAMGATGRAGEVVVVSGILEAAPAGLFFSSHFLRDPNNGGLIAGLRDSGGRLFTGSQRVTLVGEKTATPEINGLPTLKVLSLLPEYWAQPSIWTDKQQLPGTFSNHPRGAKPKDFAGVPFTTFRAYKMDNGWETRRLDAPSETETPPPLKVGPFLLNADGFFGAVQAFTGLTYELQHLKSLDELPQTIASTTATIDGTLSIGAPRQEGTMGFYLIRVTSLLSP
jgi:hypothetical protein